MPLRDYQRRLNESILSELILYRSTIACAATGSGKTHMFIDIAQKELDKGYTILILSETIKIYRQIVSKLHAMHINPHVKNIPIIRGKCYIAMTQTLVRRTYAVHALSRLASNLLVIVDEAHIGTHTELLRKFPDARIIGFTASPDWRSAKHLPDIYQSLVLGPQPHELIQEGHLCPYKHFERQKADLTFLQKKSTGDFSEESQKKVFEAARVYDGLHDDLALVSYSKAIIFCASIKHAEDVRENLSAYGFISTLVHSKQGKDAEENLRQFTNGVINICVSVGQLTKGFDFPPIDLVILLRATTSLALYLQMIGRGSRTYPGKQSFTVLDYGGNGTRHGLWDQDRPWQQLWRPQNKRKDSVAPIKCCPNCDTLMPASAMKCKECGYIFLIKEKEPIKDSVLIELTEDYNKITGMHVSSLSPEQLAIYAKSKNKKAHAVRVAKAQEQKTPGFLEQFGNAMGYKRGWAMYQLQGLTEPIEFYDTVLK